MTRSEFEIQTDYGFGHGWERTTTEETKADGLQMLADYRRNQPEFRHRLALVIDGRTRSVLA